MSQSTLPVEQQPRPTTNQWERDVIFTANGSKEASNRVYRAGALVGMESLNTRPPEEIPVEFVDWPWRKLADYGGNVEVVFEKHIAVVDRERPKYAVAPDVMGDLPLPAALEYADELKQYADTVIVPPKTVHPARVPDEFRVGMPCQDRYGGTPWPWPEYQDCAEVHCLGGSPVKHHEILKHYIPVESIDTSVPVQSARWGSYWRGDQWTKTERDEAFYWCLKTSYATMRQSMNPDRDVWDPRPRNKNLDYEEAFRELDDTGLFDHDEHIPRPPRAAYYECDSPTELAEYVLNQVR